jgi:hypothetical protein
LIFSCHSQWFEEVVPTFSWKLCKFSMDRLRRAMQGSTS